MKQESVLIVEDNPILREGLQEMLELEGFQVYTASNGRQALDDMKDFSPDLILSDIAMPIMDGYEFFYAVRDRSEWISIPFVFLTARGEREDVLTGKDMGAEDYLIKPVTREDLITVVNSRLERSHQLHVVQLQQAYETSLAVLANAIEVRDQYTRGHVERVMAYAFAMMCDYVLLGEEIYAGAAQVSENPLMLSGIAIEEIGKAFVYGMIALGFILSVLGVSAATTFGF